MDVSNSLIRSLSISKYLTRSRWLRINEVQLYIILVTLLYIDIYFSACVLDFLVLISQCPGVVDGDSAARDSMLKTEVMTDVLMVETDNIKDQPFTSDMKVKVSTSLATYLDWTLKWLICHLPLPVNKVEQVLFTGTSMTCTLGLGYT